MTVTLVIGILATGGATLLAAAYHRAPTRVLCPQCGARTAAVMPPPFLRRSRRWIEQRWCPRCSWEGMGRNGPERVPGRKAAHDSGFSWGTEEMEEDMGFEWAGAPLPEPTPEPPHHPSGFRFAPGEGPRPHPAHPSGFAWARRVGPRPPGLDDDEAAHPSGFTWGDSGGAPVFRWKDASAGRESAGFRWKGVA